MRTFVKMFMPRFAPLVENGSKNQTVRPMPTRMPVSLDRVSLREWTGKPYRSKQRILGEAVITRVANFEMTHLTVTVGGKIVGSDEFALADGFNSFEDMRLWFAETHGLPFKGILIKWEPLEKLIPLTSDDAHE